MGKPAILLDRGAVLETRPRCRRIGLIALATDHTTECDFTAMRPGDDPAIYVNRVAFANPAGPDNLLAMQPLLTGAASLILPGEPLHAVAYACTAASALIGDPAIREAIRAAKPGVPVVTPTAAAFRAFAALGLRRVSVLTPYTAAVTGALVRYFEEGGLEVLNASCFGLDDDGEIARVHPDSIVAAAIAARHRGAEGLFISCTALRAVAVAEAIEQRLGIPVVTSNQAMFWQAVREAGCPAPVRGFGRLFDLDLQGRPVPVVHPPAAC